MIEEEINEIEPYRIDIRKMFRDKNAKLAKWIPGFVYRYIEKIVHQDENNWFLEKHGTKIGMDFIEAIKYEFNVDYTIRGENNLPKPGGRYIFVTNHPLGGFDGVLIMHYLHRFFPKQKFLVNDLLMNVKNLQPLFLPINKHGKQAREHAALIDEYYASDYVLLNCPSGIVSRRKKGVIKDPEWKKSFLAKAIKHNREIVPLHFEGKNSNWFYNLSSFRRFFGIKANLEMFYLVDEFYKQKNNTFTISIGKTIPLELFKNTKDLHTLAQAIKEHAYSLKKNENISYNFQK